MKLSFYGHFVGGEDKQKITPLVSRMKKYGVRPILDYAVEEDLNLEKSKNLEKNGTSSNVKDDDKRKEAIGGEMRQYKPNDEYSQRKSESTQVRTFFYEGEAACDRHTDNFIESLRAVADDAKTSKAFAAMKLTALGRPQLLFQLSEVIMRAREFAFQISGRHGTIITQHLSIEDLEKNLKKAGIPDASKFLQNVEKDKDGIINLFPWAGIVNAEKELNETFKVPSLKEGKMVPLITQLSKDEEEMFRNMLRRFNRLVHTAEELNVCLMVDGEHSYFQPAISRMTLEMMNRYNKSKCILMNTYQAYLKNAYDELTSDLEEAQRENFYFGCKLVRGAYIEHERERAQKLGYPDPCNESFEATTAMFNKATNAMFEKIKANFNKDKLKIVIASHNEDTIRYVLQEMEKYGVARDANVIFFAQLLGMCDFITFPLGQAGYSGYKYVPYGPVHEVLPYLSRRLRENKSMLTKLKKEKKLLLSELLRRTKKRQLLHKP